jgi:regulator of sigma E protease
MNSFLPFIAMIGIVVFIHELGHFLIGKFFKLEILEFSIGVGPKLLGFQKGLTVYKLCLIPIGGYVRFNDDSVMGLTQAPLHVRFFVSVAGPLFNYILAFFVFFTVWTSGIQELSSQIFVLKNSVASSFGLQSGDIVKSINHKPINSWSELTETVQKSPGQTLDLEVQRNQKLLSLKVTPEKTQNELQQATGKVGILPEFTKPILCPLPSSYLGEKGIICHDTLISVNGNQINSFQDFLNLEITSQPWDFEILRDDKIQHLSIPSTHNYEKETYPLEALIKSSSCLPEKSLILGLSSKSDFSSENGASSLVNPIFRRDIELWISKYTQKLIFINYLVLGESPKTVQCSVPLNLEFTEEPSIVSRKITILNGSEAFNRSLKMIADQTQNTLIAIQKLFTLQLSPKVLGGPILIAKVAKNAAEEGMSIFFMTLGGMSLNIGLFNLLPLPPLDGGHILFQFFEFIYRKPLPKFFQEWFVKFGIVFLLSMMALVFFNDIQRLFQ